MIFYGRVANHKKCHALYSMRQTSKSHNCPAQAYLGNRQ